MRLVGIDFVALCKSNFIIDLSYLTLVSIIHKRELYTRVGFCC